MRHVEPLATPAFAPPRPVRGPLLLVDIGGYTAFLQAVAAAHKDDAFADGNVPDAYAMVSSLLDGIVGRMVPPFSLAKLEGDAVFVYATDLDDIPRGSGFLAALRRCHDDFVARLGEAGVRWVCQCDACARISSLDLKFIVHAGPYVIQAIAGREELSGPDVVLAHRLLKSRAAEVVGHGAFALVTDAACSALEVPTDVAKPIVEQYDHYPPVRAHVFAVHDLAG